jgi:hypothetical protein
MGMYIKNLRIEGELQSEMTETILKNSISILEKFNHVRNHQSFAHSNEVLNTDESWRIFKTITAIMEFINTIERNRDYGEMQKEIDEEEIEQMTDVNWTELPF